MKTEKMKLTPLRRLADAQRGGAIVALGAGILFWFFLGLREGLLMFFSVVLILQPFLIYEYWKDKRNSD